MKTTIKDVLKYFFEVPPNTSMDIEDFLVSYLWLRGYKIVPIETEVR